MPPVRGVVKKPVYEYTYESLVEHIRDVITERYGSLSAFVASKDFDGVGFDNARTIKTNIYVYLSSNTKTKSFPTLKKLYLSLLNVNLEGKVEVIRTLKITSTKQIGT